MAKRRSPLLAYDDDPYTGPPSGIIHKCSACGKLSPWGPGWAWYGAYRDMDEGVPIYKACSDECMARREEVMAARRADLQLQQARELLAEAERNAEHLRKRVATLEANSPPETLSSPKEQD